MKLTRAHFFVILLFIGLAIVGMSFLSDRPEGGSKAVSDVFETSTGGLSVVKGVETVELADGDEYALTASYVKKMIGGREVRMLAYNGSVPGPVIKVPQGGEVTINFKNEMDVPTTIHSHGVRLANSYDGVPGVTQPEIPPGGSFSYKIRFPDAGVFWYHPHMREDYTQELGLYGNYIVVPTNSSFWSPANIELPLFVDDILLDGSGIAPFKTDTVERTLMGRFGNVMLLNGDPEFSLSVEKGSVARFYLTNSANTRVFNLSIPGTRIKLVGSDGGRYEKEAFVEEVMLAPSERAVIEVFFKDAGMYEIRHMTPTTEYVLGKITITDRLASPSYVRQFETIRDDGSIRTEVPDLDSHLSRRPDKYLTLSVGMEGMMSSMMQGGSSDGHAHDHGSMGSMMGSMGAAAPIEWEDHMPEMNAVSDDVNTVWKIVDRQTKKENMDIHWTFNEGNRIKISIFNDDHSMHPMQHPIHFHGQRFLVLSRDGVENTNMVWKDTVLIGAGETVDILLDASNTGQWMAHCHIAEHLHSGMMFEFNVE